MTALDARFGLIRQAAASLNREPEGPGEDPPLGRPLAPTARRVFRPVPVVVLPPARPHEDHGALRVGHEMVLVRWRRGRKLVVWPPPVSKARPLYPRPLVPVGVRTDGGLAWKPCTSTT
jgi:hypothetical protein